MCTTKKLFVSYTLKDKELTIGHLFRLKTQVPLTFDTYIDILDNESQDKQQRVNDELFACDKLTLIDTPSVRISGWVNHELAMMQLLNKPIETILAESIDITSNPFKMRHKVFISYHHANDQWAKDRLIELNEQFKFFIDESVDTGDIPDEWDDQKIRREIRDNYLRTSTVTILLVGTETQYRKHIDWELFSSMYDGTINKRSGLIVIMLPSTCCTSCHASFENEKKSVFPQIDNWVSVNTRAEYERRYPNMPPRIIDQLMKDGVKVSVANWNELTVEKLALMIDNAANNRANNDYDMSRQMRRRNN